MLWIWWGGNPWRWWGAGCLVAHSCRCDAQGTRTSALWGSEPPFSRHLAWLAFPGSSPRSWESVAALSQQEVETVPIFLKAWFGSVLGRFRLHTVWVVSGICKFGFQTIVLCLGMQWQHLPDRVSHTWKPKCAGKSTSDKMRKRWKCDAILCRGYVIMPKNVLSKNPGFINLGVQNGIFAYILSLLNFKLLQEIFVF